MIEKGKIIKIKGDKATVQFDRKSACDRCHMCAVVKDPMKVQIVVKNTLNLSVGDYVAVEMGQRYVVTAAAIVYMIPLALTGVGIGLGTLLSELWQVIFAFIGLIIGFGIAIALDKVLKNKKGFTPKMVSVPLEEEKFTTITTTLASDDNSSDAESEIEAEDFDGEEGVGDVGDSIAEDAVGDNSANDGESEA